MVRATGLEPARFWQWNLNPPSLPIPPCPLIFVNRTAVHAAFDLRVILTRTLVIVNPHEISFFAVCFARSFPGMGRSGEFVPLIFLFILDIPSQCE